MKSEKEIIARLPLRKKIPEKYSRQKLPAIFLQRINGINLIDELRASITAIRAAIDNRNEA